MKPPPFALVVVGAGVLAAMLLTMGWRLAGVRSFDRESSFSPAFLATKGPIETAFCGPPVIPKAPPPIDSPYGVHLFAAQSLGTVTLLPSMSEYMETLPLLVGVAGGDKGVQSSAAVSLVTRERERQPILPAVSVVSQEPVSGAGSERRDEVVADAPRVMVNETVEEDVQVVVTLLEEYRRAFGAMPVGEQNFEIVLRLQGENPKGIAVLPKSHPNISPEGELLDRWGTPYRFHPESAWVMTVRSAGPDRQMWTHDDVLSDLAETMLQL